jgi:hypothetical protein
VITSYSWNYDGGLLATVARDKMLRVIDPRRNASSSKSSVSSIADLVAEPTPAAETVDHQGAKSSRVVWAGRKDKIITGALSCSFSVFASKWCSSVTYGLICAVGFTKTSDREIAGTYISAVVSLSLSLSLTSLDTFFYSLSSVSAVSFSYLSATHTRAQCTIRGTCQRG